MIGAERPEGTALRVLALPYAMMPTPIIGTIRPLQLLAPDVELRVRLPGAWAPSDVEWADVVAFSRNIDADSLRAFRLAAELGKPTVYEVDDSYFDAPAGVPSFRKYRTPTALGIHREFLRDATRVHTYSARVHEGVRALGGRPFRFVPYFDARDLVGVDELRVRAGVLEDIQIALPTGRSEAPATEASVHEVLRAALESFPKARLHVWREHDLGDFGDRVVRHPARAFQEFLADLRTIGIDVALAILGTTPFEASKSNNKYRDLGGSGIPGIYSDVAVYRECVRDGETGLLADNNVESWLDAITRLQHDEALRRRIVTSARADIAENFAVDRVTTFWTEALHDALERAEGRRSPSVQAVQPVVRQDPAWGFAGQASYLRRVLDAVPSARAARAPRTASQGPERETEVVRLLRLGPAGRLPSDWVPMGTVVDLSDVDDPAALFARLPARSVLVTRAPALPPDAERPMWGPPVQHLDAGPTVVGWDDGDELGPSSWGFAMATALDSALGQLARVDIERSDVRHADASPARSLPLSLDWTAGTALDRRDALTRLARFNSRLRVGWNEGKRAFSAVRSHPGGPIAYLRMRREVHSQSVPPGGGESTVTSSGSLPPN